MNWNVPLACPVEIVTLPGMVTEPGPVAAKFTVMRLGAGPGNVIVPVAVLVRPSELGPKFRAIAGWFTVTCVFPGWKFGAVANNKVPPVCNGVIVAVALVPLAGIVTVDGAEIIVVSNGVRVTVRPPGLGAGVPMDTVNVAGVFENRANGFGVSVITAPAFALIVTVDGALSTNPSFTMSCRTKTPATSAVKVGPTAAADDSEALLPPGAFRIDHL